MNKKNMIAVLLALLVIVVPFASAQELKAEEVIDVTNDNQYLEISSVRINGDYAEDGDILQVKRGETLDIRVTVKAGQNDVRNAEIQAFIAGYRYSKYERELVSDFEGPFNLPAGNKRSHELSLKIPFDMEQKDAKLRIVVSDENSPYLIVYNYQLNIEGADESNAVTIRDFLISPSSEIEAGRALSFKVRVKNIGMSNLDDVKVTVAIPELNIQTHETIDELEGEETQSFEALLLRIPSDAKAGTYDVVATVEFDKYERVRMTKTITVTGAQTTPTTTKTTVTMPESVEVVKGTTGAVYPILLQNHDSVAKTYVISVSGVSNWATSSFEPSSVVIVNGGESKTVYLKLSAKDDAEAGDKVFRVTIQSGSDVSETSAVASIKDDSTQKTTTELNLRAVLEWSLIILIVVLIILGLVLVFTRMRKSGKDDDEETQTYY